MSLKTLHFPTVVGAASTTASGYAVRGTVEAVVVRAANGPAGPTLDVTLRTKGEGPPSYTVLALTNLADGTVYRMPREPGVTSSGAAQAAGDVLYEPFRVADRLEVVVAQGDADTEVEVWVLYDDGRAD